MNRRESCESHTHTHTHTHTQQFYPKLKLKKFTIKIMSNIRLLNVNVTLQSHNDHSWKLAAILKSGLFWICISYSSEQASNNAASFAQMKCPSIDRMNYYTVAKYSVH